MDINNILVTGRLHEEMKCLLEGRFDKEFRFLPESEVSAADFAWADAYVAFRPTNQFRFGRLKWVHALGAGVDVFLHRRQWNKEVQLTRTIGSFGRKISEYCLSYMFADLQFHREFDRNTTQCIWRPSTPKQLGGQNVLILGTGTIGQEIARTLSFFGVAVTGISRSGRKQSYFARNLKLEDLDGPLPEADWLINTLPLTVETEGLFNANLFRQLRNCGFINVGRGASVCQDDLLTALEREHVRLAVLDVFAEEPLPVESPLWTARGVTITPHISAVTTPEEATSGFIKTLSLVERGATSLINLVDPDRGY